MVCWVNHSLQEASKALSPTTRLGRAHKLAPRRNHHAVVVWMSNDTGFGERGIRTIVSVCGLLCSFPLSNLSVFFLYFWASRWPVGWKENFLLLGVQQISGFAIGWRYCSSSTTIRGLTWGRTAAVGTLVKVETSIGSELGRQWGSEACSANFRGQKSSLLSIIIIRLSVYSLHFSVVSPFHGLAQLL